jgi:excisionase family DNA binding protein
MEDHLMTITCTHTDERPLTVKGASLHLGVGERMVRKLVSDRKLKFIKVGALLRFRPCDLDEFLDYATVQPGEPRRSRTGGMSAMDAVSRAGIR